MNNQFVGICGIILAIILVSIPVVYAEIILKGMDYEEGIIPITITNTMGKVEFDGQWSHYDEWKSTTLTELKYNDGKIILRSAHQDGFLYFLIDDLTDFTYNRIADRAMICLDSGDKSGKKPDKSVWCYVAARGSLNGHTLNGGVHTVWMNYLGLVKSHPEYIGVGGTSGVNDRYIITPHAAYEFRIPIEQIGFQDSYGFYMQVVNGDNVKTFPEEFSGEYLRKLPSPSEWTSIISIDKSITKK